ncbi:MAG: DUF4350 domain-containing protein [Porticoccaceae bacterium]|nr:DUF4350 domain-containing protein [Pseudomonadales bacterium]MCP5173441.1 DUF4350 domain-containing protein [Pseudomonadales bacterium]MCP5303254.1 DUF4350 domain-containing protein [Pseudomonadales bacterium]
MFEKVFKPLLALLIILSGYLIYLNIERKETVVNSGPTPEVIRNPYLAAVSYLQNKGLSATQQTRPLKAVDLYTDDMLVITDNSAITEMGLATDLYEWVRTGGHLVWAMDGYPEESQSALAELAQIGRYFPEDQDQVDESAEEKSTLNDADESLSEQLEEYNQALKSGLDLPAEKVADDEALTPSQLVKKAIADHEAGKDIQTLTVLVGKNSFEDLFIDQGYGVYLDHPFLGGVSNSVGPTDQALLYAAGPPSAEGARLLHFRVGAGNMTVLLSTDIWLNHQIGRYDHAHLLWLLAGDATRVVFQSHVQWPPWWQLLLDWALEFVVIVGILFFALLIKLGTRFGPVQGSVPAIRRSMIEHISAMAKFHWRHQHVDHLIEPLRSAIYNKMRIIHSGFDELSDRERHRLIAEKSQLPLVKIEEAFAKRNMLTERQFCQVIHLLEIIRKSL